MLLGMNVCSVPLYTAGAGTVNISFVFGIAGSSKAYSSVILNDISMSQTWFSLYLHNQ